MIGVHLAKDPSPVDVVVIAHPGNIAAKDFAEICKPFALVCAEGAFLFTLRFLFLSPPAFSAPPSLTPLLNHHLAVQRISSSTMLSPPPSKSLTS